MDLRNDHFFCQVKLSGIKEPLILEGSFMHVTSEIMRLIRPLNPKDTGNGKRIEIEFSAKPFSEQVKLTRAELDLQLAINAIPDSDGMQPKPGETYIQYYDRLIDEQQQYPKAAKWFADDFFDMPKDSELLFWMNDEKAKRFRHLQASARAFEQASPEEYSMLKAYVIQTYPSIIKDLTFRTA